MKHTGDYKWDEALTRQELGRRLSDEQWAELWDEFAGRMDNYGNDLLDELLSKYDAEVAR
jgi:hypothetical protein